MELPDPTAFKKRILGGDLLTGPWICLPYPMNIEILARSKADFLLLDGEHSAITSAALPELLPAAELAGMPVVFRVRTADGGEIKAALDAGVSTVMIPMVETATQARELVSLVKYPPRGRRGIGPWRASKFYEDAQTYLETANDRSTVVVQIETAKGLENAAEIAEVDGVDVLFVGPTDLSAALGLPLGEMSDGLLEASLRVAGFARAAGKVAGTDIVSLESLPALHKGGFTFFSNGSDIAFLQSAANDCITEFRQRLG